MTPSPELENFLERLRQGRALEVRTVRSQAKYLRSRGHFDAAHQFDSYADYTESLGMHRPMGLKAKGPQVRGPSGQTRLLSV